MEPPVAGPERDIGVRAERIVVVIAKGVERRFRNAGAPRGEDDGRRPLQRYVRRLLSLLAISEQGFRPAKVGADPLEELCDTPWREAVADGTGYVAGPDQRKHQRDVTLVSGQVERNPAPRFEFSETERRGRDLSVQLLVGGDAPRADEGSCFRSGERRRPQRTGDG